MTHTGSGNDLAHQLQACWLPSPHLCDLTLLIHARTVPIQRKRVIRSSPGRWLAGASLTVARTQALAPNLEAEQRCHDNQLHAIGLHRQAEAVSGNLAFHCAP